MIPSNTQSFGFRFRCEYKRARWHYFLATDGFELLDHILSQANQTRNRDCQDWYFWYIEVLAGDLCSLAWHPAAVIDKTADFDDMDAKAGELWSRIERISEVDTFPCADVLEFMSRYPKPIRFSNSETLKPFLTRNHRP